MITAWDKWGPLRGPVPAGACDELQTYARIAFNVALRMHRAGLRERNWTSWRIASTAMAEAQSDEPWTDRRRRIECGADRGDFRRRLGPIYDQALSLATMATKTKTPGMTGR